jgi:hypothetical protein
MVTGMTLSFTIASLDETVANQRNVNNLVVSLLAPVRLEEVVLFTLAESPLFREAKKK